MMLSLKNLDIASLTKKELKFLVREFCRKRIIEGYHKDEISLMVRKEFKEAIDGENPLINISAIHQWISQQLLDLIDADRDNKRDYYKNLAVAQKRLEHMYNLCIRKGDEKTALRVLQELHSLQGLSEGKMIFNLGFQQNNFNNNGHTSGSAPQYTPFSNLSDEELKQQQKAIAQQPINTFDVLQQIKDVQNKTGEVAYVKSDEVEKLIEIHNSQFEDGDKTK